MPRFRPVIRVFVSSTFSDLKQERNALQAQVFPKLEQLCAQNGFQFQAIDLRWGVSSEAGLDHRTMRICFDELRRAQEISPRPNFLILLGNRYGWRPLPEEISVAEFQALEHAAAQVATTTDKPAAAVLQTWYRRDENAVPPVYLLQSRRQQLPDVKDCTQDAPWNEIQAILWVIINRAQPPEQLRGRFDAASLAEGSPPAIVRFQASATEQEIWHGALRVPDAREHVLAFFRQIENVGEFSEPKQIKRIKDFVDVEPSGIIDASLPAEQERLKETLRKRLGGANVFEARATVRVFAAESQGQSAADVTTDHLGKLCSEVETRLRDIIQGQIDEYWRLTKPGSAERAARELEIELQEHARASQERGGAETFVGREDKLKAVHDFLLNDSTWPLVVRGASGCGKTALLSRAAQEAAALKPVVRLIGTHPRCSDLRGLLSSLCQELRLRHSREGELPTDIKALGEELMEHFKSATSEQPLILFLDALDQLSDADNGRLLNWIPTGQLPPHVKLILSCLSDRPKDDPAGQPFAELTRRQLPAKNLINLDALSENEASTLLFDRWLPQAGRTVSREQRERIEKILKSKECRQPIYLKLLFEEARLWRSYDSAPELGESVPAILGQLIERLSQPANHGRLLVERVLGYLAASRHGLAENEILEILFADPEYKAALDQATEQTRHELPASAKRIPIAIWSRLRFDLAPYLTERAAPGANVLTFYHRQVAEWVQEHFVKATDQSWQPHRWLADYFTACAKGSAEEWETESVRGYAECIYQLIEAEQHEQAAGLLCNFPFLLHKLRVGLLEGVFEDYEIFRKTASANNVLQLDIWYSFFREKAHILRRGNEEWPAHKILLQIAVEHADDSPLTTAAEQWLKENRCNWLWFRRVLRSSHSSKNPCMLTFDVRSSINGALELSNGRVLSWCNDTTLQIWDTTNSSSHTVLEGHQGSVSGALILTSRRLLSWALDCTLRVWDSHAGVSLTTLAGHASYITGAIALDEHRVLSWAQDHTIKFWNTLTGACLATQIACDDGVIGVLKLTDGRLLSWSDKGKTLKLRDRNSAAFLKALEGHPHPKYVMELTGQRLVSWAAWGHYDGTLCVTNDLDGRGTTMLHGHSSWVNGVLESSPGRIVSWSDDKTLRIWDASSSECLMVLIGHNDGVLGAIKLLDGGLLSWSSDGTLRLWNVNLGGCLQVFSGHGGRVHGAMELTDGRMVSWSGDDRTLRVWNMREASCLAVLQGHSGFPIEVAKLADGRLLSWSGDNTLRVWDVQRADFQNVSKRHTRGVLGALRLADGRILSWSSDKTLRLWDGSTGEHLATLEGHTGYEIAAQELKDGRLLSWSSDKTLRVWDNRTGACLAVLKGHDDAVKGALELTSGDVLSWSNDGTLRLWAGRKCGCLAVLRGHTGNVHARVLTDGRLLSWSTDGTARLWDGHSGKCLMTLKGHTSVVDGARELTDGKLLTWSWDKTLRLWDSHTGACIVTFRGHTEYVTNALELSDGRMLSASDDQTLRVWDKHTGGCLAILAGHKWVYMGALELADGKILSWSPHDTFRLWNAENGKCLEVVEYDKCVRLHPDWYYAKIASIRPSIVNRDFFVGDDYTRRSVELRHKERYLDVSAWHSDSEVTARCLQADGSTVVLQADGQVCFLKLHHGNRRVSLAEAEVILSSQKQASK